MEDVLVGRIVKIIVAHPDGVPTDVFGEIGVIVSAKITANMETTYTICTGKNKYEYAEDQFRYATPVEIEHALAKVILNRTYMSDCLTCMVDMYA